MSSYPIKHILLIEENPTLQDVILKALATTSEQHQVYLVNDPQAALNFLYRRGEYAQSPRPQLILFDVNRPEINQPDFLQTIKSDSTLKIIPVVVLTNSDNWNEIVRGDRLQANCYLDKPLELDRLFKTIEKLGKFWLQFVEFPSI